MTHRLLVAPVDASPELYDAVVMVNYLLVQKGKILDRVGYIEGERTRYGSIVIWDDSGDKVPVISPLEQLLRGAGYGKIDAVNHADITFRPCSF